MKNVSILPIMAAFTGCHQAAALEKARAAPDGSRKMAGDKASGEPTSGKKKRHERNDPAWPY